MISAPLYTALLDANILYPAGIRDILFRIATHDLCDLKWSPDIRRELMSTFRKLRSDSEYTRFSRHTLPLIDKFLQKGLIKEYDHIVGDVEGINDKDIHVVAAAIRGNCSIILTNNIRHFPAQELENYDITAMTPDEFLVPILQSQPGEFCVAVRNHRTSLSRPPYSIDEYLIKLETDGLIKTSRELRYFAPFL